MGGIVSGIGDLFGGGGNNASFTAQSAPLIQPVTSDQVNQGTNAATQGVATYQDLVKLLSGQTNQGVQSQSNLTNALTNQANGIGPNPAQAALAQNTGQNIANQSALLAGQRGSNVNVGLEGRNIAMQGANIQQQAAGQAATLQAQQQLAAQQQLGQLAGTQIGQSLGAIGGLNQASLGNQGQLLGALQGYNTNQVSNTGNMNQTNEAMAAQNAKNTAGTLGGALNGLGGGLMSFATPVLKKAFGAEGGQADQILAKAQSQKSLPPHMKAMADIYHPNVIQKMACGGMAKGAVVPGDPKVPGENTIKNDVVPAMLTPKEIVLPLSVTQSKNPGEAAKAFVEKIKGKDSLKEAVKEHIKNRKSKK